MDVTGDSGKNCAFFKDGGTQGTSCASSYPVLCQSGCNDQPAGGEIPNFTEWCLLKQKPIFQDVTS